MNERSTESREKPFTMTGGSFLLIVAALTGAAATGDATITFGAVTADPQSRQFTQNWLTPGQTDPAWTAYHVTVQQTLPTSQTIVDADHVHSDLTSYTFSLGARPVAPLSLH